METALGIPEIRSALGPHLDLRSIKQCLLVSKSWHDTFIPFRWSTFYLDYRCPPTPTPNFIQYRHHIRHLTLYSTVSEPYLNLLLLSKDEEGDANGLPLCRLEELHLRQFRILGTTVSSSWLADFIRQQTSTLRVLHYDPRTQRMPDPSIWEAIATCHHLQELQLQEITFSEETWESVWQVLKMVQSIDLKLVTFSRDSVPTQILGPAHVLVGGGGGSAVAKMKRFHIEGTEVLENGEWLLWMLKQCPDLVSLEVEEPCPDGPALFPTREFCKELARQGDSSSAGTWKDLVRVKINGQVMMEEAPYILLLEGIPLLEVFGASESSFGLDSFAVLRRRHLETLQELDLKDCRQVSSGMVRTLLEECPVLKVLSATEITAEDILSSLQEWSCQGCLKSLTIDVVLTATDANHQDGHDENRAVLERLSRLEKLEYFHIQRPKHRRRDMDRALKPTLDMSLDNGLELLRTWKCLKWIGPFRGMNITAANTEWMIRNWPRLESIRGRINMPKDQLKALSEQILGRQIKVVRR